ncbi:MAG: ferrous iron transport protein A [Planctomycetota bacterium]|nr:MAG: ferrous iron transport protein A [Planctomycetota bacterium]
MVSLSEIRSRRNEPADPAGCPAGITACPRNLRRLRPGEEAVIVGIDEKRSSAKRLADLGFVRGAKLEMLCPGTPCLVKVAGACIGLGAAHQDCILLR